MIDRPPLRIVVPGWGGLRAVTFLFALTLALFQDTAGQEPVGEIALLVEISGQVLDSERAPLEGASVILERVSVGGGVSSDSRLAVTGADGSYHFRGLAHGEYRLRVIRIGYMGATIDVDLRTARVIGLSIGLEIDPITLTPLEVMGGTPEPYGRTQPIEASTTGRSLYLERLRQQRYLVSDTRELTHADVIAAVTLAETDLFRALQRVPGVSTRDDYTATMWTRGASWDQTRVYFDGLPLYNPTHAGWLFAAVNPDAIGSASFHPGYRSVRWGEGSAGVLDLRSRTGRNSESVRGNAEVSFASARLSLDGEIPGADLRWMVAGRRSYVDVLSAVAEGIAGRDDLHIPYDFTDIVARVDAPLGGGWGIEASSILEYDHLRGDIPGLLEGNRGRWGNRAARVTAGGPVGPVTTRLTLGGTDFSTLIFEKEADSGTPIATLPTLENGIEHRSMTIEIEPATASGSQRDWALGASVARDSVNYDGPFSLLGALVTDGARDPLTQSPFTYGSSLNHAAAWGERRWSLGSRVTAITGLRFEIGDSVSNGGRLRIAPRGAIRAEPTDGLAFTAGWSRGYQYTQDVSPAAGPIGPQLHLSAIWVLASSARAFPAVQTDLMTLGAERSWGDGWSVVANVYDRVATGLKIPNPTPGFVTLGRDPDAEASNRARGLELSLRRLTGSWTGSVGYSWGRSEMESQPRNAEEEAITFPASADIRGSLDASVLVMLGRSVRLGGAFTYGSGVPYTRLIFGDKTPASPPPSLGSPNAERTPSYASLDLMAEYGHSIGDWQVSAYLQVRNLSNRDNSVTYSGSWDCPSSGTPSGTGTFSQVCASAAGVTDRFETGLPRLPLLGVRIAF